MSRLPFLCAAAAAIATTAALLPSSPGAIAASGARAAATAAAPGSPAQPATRSPASTTCPGFLDHDFKRLRSSETLNLCSFAGRPMLIVNTASHCGFTGQFEGLEALHQKYRARGLVVVGFPSDDFHQEANDEAETAEVCFVNYGVKFPMLAPTQVRGRDANPVFRELARQTREPSWNFNKYRVAAYGRVVAQFGSTTGPDSQALANAIEKLL